MRKARLCFVRAKTGGKSENPDLPPAVIRITKELMLQQPN